MTQLRKYFGFENDTFYLKLFGKPHVGHDKLYRNIKHWRGEVGYIPGSSFFNAYLPKYKGHLKEPSGVV